jgi:hypothetical protein
MLLVSSFTFSAYTWPSVPAGSTSLGLTNCRQKIAKKNPFQPKSEVWSYTPVIPLTQEAQVGGSATEGNLGKKLARSHLKNYSNKKGWDVAEVVECFPSKPKALSSNPILPKIPKNICIHRKICMQ